ncbi:MAG: biopolymer transporter ExbD, partial [Pseudomonadota bacterium]
ASSSGGGTNYDEPIAEMNVIPLVDVILVVLIIFMVTAPLVLKPSIDVNLPQASSADQQKSKAKNIEVVISKNGELYLDGKTIDLEGLKGAVATEAKTSPESSVVLTADKDVTLDGLTKIIDAIKGSGIKKVGFSIQKK